MIRKTVFIIGAGASAEIGLPTGSELKTNISLLLNFDFDKGGYKGDEEIKRIISRKDNKSLYYEACKQISSNIILAKSIDNYLYEKGENPYIDECSKLAIVRAILLAENNSLYIKDNNTSDPINFPAVIRKWITIFWMIIKDGCVVADLEERFSKISLIIFNYDRCVEHFLIQALCKYYPISFNEAARIINKINIYHPYGLVGNLPWQKPISNDVVDFGESVTSNVLESLAKNIKTFKESMIQSEELNLNRKELLKAERIVFLGYGYHSINNEFLFPENLYAHRELQHEKYVTVFGTADGFSTNNFRHLISFLEQRLKISSDNLILDICKCHEFLSENERYLEFK